MPRAPRITYADREHPAHPCSRPWLTEQCSLGVNYHICKANLDTFNPDDLVEESTLPFICCQVLRGTYPGLFGSRGCNGGARGDCDEAHSRIYACLPEEPGT